MEKGWVERVGGNRFVGIGLGELVGGNVLMGRGWWE